MVSAGAITNTRPPAQGEKALPAVGCSAPPGSAVLPERGAFAVTRRNRGITLLRPFSDSPAPGQDNHHPVAARPPAPASREWRGAAPVQIGSPPSSRMGWNSTDGAGGLEQEEAGASGGGPPVYGPAGRQVGDHRLHLTGIRPRRCRNCRAPARWDGVAGEIQPEVAA